MKTLFTQDEIQQALVNYMSGQGIVTNDRNINVTFIRGRKGAGISAEVEVTDPANRFAAQEAVTNVKEDPTPNEPVAMNPAPVELPETEQANPEPIEQPQQGTSVPSLEAGTPKPSLFS